MMRISGKLILKLIEVFIKRTYDSRDKGVFIQGVSDEVYEILYLVQLCNRHALTPRKCHVYWMTDGWREWRVLELT